MEKDKEREKVVATFLSTVHPVTSAIQSGNIKELNSILADTVGGCRRGNNKFSLDVDLGGGNNVLHVAMFSGKVQVIQCIFSKEVTLEMMKKKNSCNYTPFDLSSFIQDKDLRNKCVDLYIRKERQIRSNHNSESIAAELLEEEKRKKSRRKKNTKKKSNSKKGAEIEQTDDQPQEEEEEQEGVS